MTKKEEPLNLNHAELSEVKSLACPVDGLSNNKRASIISEKVNWIIKVNTNSLDSTCEYTHYWK